ncbi:MAG TPA: lipid A deacylase LpxR family protein [Mucilaginibacter sp.]|nr:lipid A deacylase LpxR family protein [Mucilaginibacter sp.]
MKIKIPLLLVGIFFAAQLFAQTHANEIGIQTDNDSYLLQGSDRYYTDGIYLYYRHALDVKPGGNLANKVLGIETGQKIFNPQSGSIFFQGADQPYLVDRPFAAYLYAGATLNLLYQNESSLKLSAQVGIIGPGAFGKEVQDFVHDHFGFYHPDGWEFQIHNEAQLNLSASYNRLLARADWIDASFASYLNLGNGFSGAGAGGMIRMGAFNQLYNSVSTQSTAIRNPAGNLLHPHEIFFYYKPMFNYVAYDATIQGGLFASHNDPNSLEITRNKEPFVFSNQLGVAFTTGRLVVDAAAIFHTKEVKEMVRSEQWGSVTALYRFK